MNVGYRPTGTEVGRAVLLRDVIDNLKMDSDYYVKKTMSYCLKEDDELLKLLKWGWVKTQLKYVKNSINVFSYFCSRCSALDVAGGLPN